MKIIEHITWDQAEIEGSQEHITCVICNILTEPRIICSTRTRTEDIHIRCGTCPRCGVTFLHPSDVLTATRLLMNQKSIYNNYFASFFLMINLLKE